jgi:hypothetical protein
MCASGCAPSLCAAAALAIAECAKTDLSWTAILASDGTNASVTLSDGYHGSTYVYSHATGTLVGASFSGDLGGWMHEDDLGVYDEPHDAAGLDAASDAGWFFIPHKTRGGVHVTHPLLRCRICGNSVSGIPACDAETWKSSVPRPTGP